MKSYYAVKAILLDIEKDCSKLKQRLKKADILVIDEFSCSLDTKEAWIEILNKFSLHPKDCLLLTDKEANARPAKKLGMALAACSCKVETEPEEKSSEHSYRLLQSVPLLEEPEETSVWYLNQIYCHAKKIPTVILETKRCVLREMTREEVKPLCEILKDIDVNFEFENEEETLLYYVTHVYNFFNYAYWGVFLKESGELIGRAGFLESSYPPEVGYVIAPSLWGQGFATELLQGLLVLAGEEFGSEEVLARVAPENKASLRVLEKCGFHRISQKNKITNKECSEKKILWFRHYSELL